MSYTIEREDPQRDLKALRAVLNNYSNSSSVFVPVLQDLADSIEEQVKPKVTEPTEFGSVVRTKTEGLFVRLGGAMGLPWGSGGALRSWDQLDVVEVLRVGIGEPTMAPAQQNAQAWQSLTGRVIRFCMRSQNCRMADGHDGGCQS